MHVPSRPAFIPKPGDDLCFRCGDSGHWFRECPSASAIKGALYYAVYSARPSPELVGVHHCTWAALEQRLDTAVGRLKVDGIALKGFSTYVGAQLSWEARHPYRKAFENFFSATYFD